MREESHLDEMRSAIRGDFERLAERRGDQELMRVTDEAPPAGALEAAAPEVAPEPDVTSPPDVALEPEIAPEADRRRSWLARMFAPP